MGVGLALGILLNGFASDIDFVQTYIINGLFHVVGKIFIKALKMLVVPLVIFYLICVVSGFGDVLMGRVGLKAFMLDMLIPTMAINLVLWLSLL